MSLFLKRMQREKLNKESRRKKCSGEVKARYIPDNEDEKEPEENEDGRTANFFFGNDPSNR